MRSRGQVPVKHRRPGGHTAATRYFTWRPLMKACALELSETGLVVKQRGEPPRGFTRRAPPWGPQKGRSRYPGSELLGLRSSAGAEVPAPGDQLCSAFSTGSLALGKLF